METTNKEALKEQYRNRINDLIDNLEGVLKTSICNRAIEVTSNWKVEAKIWSIHEVNFDLQKIDGNSKPIYGERIAFDYNSEAYDFSTGKTYRSFTFNFHATGTIEMVGSKRDDDECRLCKILGMVAVREDVREELMYIMDFYLNSYSRMMDEYKETIESKED